MEKNLMKDILKKARGEFIAEHSEEGLTALKAWDALETCGLRQALAFVRSFRIVNEDTFGEVGRQAFEAFYAAMNAALDETDAETEQNAKAAGMSRTEYMRAVVEAAEEEEEVTNAKN